MYSRQEACHPKFTSRTLFFFPPGPAVTRFGVPTDCFDVICPTPTGVGIFLNATGSRLEEETARGSTARMNITNLGMARLDNPSTLARGTREKVKT